MTIRVGINGFGRMGRLADGEMEGVERAIRVQLGL